MSLNDTKNSDHIFYKISINVKISNNLEQFNDIITILDYYHNVQMYRAQKG